MKRSFVSESLLLSYSMIPLLSLAFSSDTGLECSVPSHNTGSSKSPVLHGFSNFWSEVAAVVSYGSGSANVNNCASGTLWQTQAECSKGLPEYEHQERTSSSACGTKQHPGLKLLTQTACSIQEIETTNARALRMWQALGPGSVSTVESWLCPQDWV